MTKVIKKTILTILLLCTVCMLACFAACDFTQSPENPTNPSQNEQTENTDKNGGTNGSQNDETSDNAGDNQSGDSQSGNGQSPEHTCSFVLEKTEEKYLKAAATCTEKAVYYKSCSCGEKGTGTFEYGEWLGHDYGEWTSNGNGTHTKTCSHDDMHIITENCRGGTATCTEQATCEDCNAKYGDALGHSYTNYVSNNNATCENNATETATCDHGCGATDTRAIENTALRHSYTNYINDNNATCENNATETATCDHGCGTIDTRAIENTALGHNYDTPTYSWDGDKCTATRICLNDNTHTESETVTAEYIKDTDATCTAAEKGHYKATFKNSAFATQTTENNSVDNGETKGHSYTNYVSNNNATCVNNATETATCDHGCGTTDTRTVENSALGHSYTNYVSDNNATCESNGTETATCDHGCGTTVKTNGSYTNASYIKYVATDSYSGIANCYVKMPNSSYYIAYASGTQLATEGTYYFYAVDKSGNQTSVVSITLDKTKPTGTLYGGNAVIASGGSTNASYIKFVPYDAIGLSATYVKKPNATSYVAYTSSTQFTAEGTYSFYSVDKAGNTSATYTVTLDRNIPTGQLYVDGNPIQNNGYTNGSHIYFECAETCYVKLPDTDTFVSYASGTEFYKSGKYVFYGVSKAGNNTGYYTIVIDRTVKEPNIANVKNGVTDGDVTIDWTDGNADEFAPIIKVTVNGKAYTKGSTIYTIDTGVYKVYCVDAAGNEWTGEFRSTKNNIPTKTFQKEFYEVPDKDGNHFTFANYDNAFAFAVMREKGFIRTGEWQNASWDTGIAMDAKDSVNAKNGTYFIYKKSGSPDEEVAYFTEDRLNEVIAEYAKVGIEHYFYWEKEFAPIADGENLYSYSDYKTILANSIQFGEHIGTLADGEEFVGERFESEGRHTITVYDEWGNICDYSVIIIGSTPKIDYAVGEGTDNLVSFDRTYYFKNDVTVSIADELDEFAMFCVYDKNGDLLGKFSLGKTYTLTKSGSYTVIAINHAGKSEEFKFVISKDAPKVEMKDNTDDKKLEITVTESSDTESHIQTLEIYKSTDNGATWELLSKDDYGNTISLDKLSYAFRTTGRYKVVITDEFRTGIDAVTKEFSYTQAAPEGKLNGVTNGGYTNKGVSFEWTDEATVEVEKDGESIAYTSGTVLTADGNYTITFENFDGFRAIYEFTIDTVAPIIEIEGVEDGKTVTNDVKVILKEGNLTAELFKNGESLGEYQSETVITDSGAYTLIVTDLAGNEIKVEFTIDKFVDYEANVYNGGLSNGVIVKANEEVTYTLTKDGTEIAYTFGDEITAVGEYILTLTDKFGNTDEIRFTIVKPLVKSFEHNFDEVDGFEKATVNGEDKRLNYGTLELFDDGVFEVTVYVNDKGYTYTVEVDKTAPSVKLNGVENGGKTKGSVTVSDLSEQADMKVYRDGTEIDYKLGDELCEIGKYKIVLTDTVGNVAEYDFEILYSMNGGAIALIVIGVLAVLGVIGFVVMKKRRVFKK